MNNYLLVDYKNNVISNLNKVETDFEENEIQTGSETCNNKMDLLNNLLKLVKEEIANYAEENDIRVCSECGKLMEDGYVIDYGKSGYYCNDDCLYKNISEEEYNQLVEFGGAYFTEWY